MPGLQPGCGLRLPSSGAQPSLHPRMIKTERHIPYLLLLLDVAVSVLVFNVIYHYWAWPGICFGWPCFGRSSRWSQPSTLSTDTGYGPT